MLIKVILGMVVFILMPSFGHSQNIIHVYSKEIPWKNDIDSSESGKIYSINTAIEMALPGDEIVIHEGVYREKVVISKSGLTLRNADNDYVLVTGCEMIEHFEDAAGMKKGIKIADVSSFNIETSFSQLFINGVAQMLARHPNNITGRMMEPLDPYSGYALIYDIHKDEGANANCYATFDDTTLPDVDLTGGIFRGLIGKNRMYVFGDVVYNSGNRITFKGLNNGQWKAESAIETTFHKAGWGFIIHKNLIDEPGEWFLEKNKLYLFPKEGMALENQRVEIQVRKRILEIENVDGVSIIGLNFVAGNALIENVANLVFDNCTWRYLHPFWIPSNYGDSNSKETGILLSKAENTSFLNCYLGHTWGQGFYIESGDGTVFYNCIMEDLGWIGIFTSAIWTGGNVSIKQCTFGQAGRFHLRIRKNVKLEVTDCDFFGAMKLGEDAGPIEATSTGSLEPLDLKGSLFAYNKIHDCKGIPVFAGGYAKQFVVAFYMEDTENYTAHHNLIYNFRADNYKGPHDFESAGAFLYLGPRYNFTEKPINYYNNTVWNIDKGINIWHIEVDNWEQLGLQHTGGAMLDGHFENNIIQDRVTYQLNWTKQIINSNGSMVKWVSVDNPPSIVTVDFEEFVTNAENVGYHFNAQNNVFLALSDQNANFLSADEGNFILSEKSVAKNAGKPISGITSSQYPDCGALEGGERVLRAGSLLKIPDFLEMQECPTQIVKPYFLNFSIKLFPNPVSNYFYLEFEGNEVISLNKIKFYDFNGCVVYPSGIKVYNNKIECDVSNLSKGLYFIFFDNHLQNSLSFVKY